MIHFSDQDQLKTEGYDGHLKKASWKIGIDDNNSLHTHLETTYLWISLEHM